MSTKTSDEVNPLAQIDDLQYLNIRIGAVVSASYDVFEDLHDTGSELKSGSQRITTSADRGMILLALVKDLIQQSQDQLTKQYAVLAGLGMRKMEPKP